MLGLKFLSELHKSSALFSHICHRKYTEYGHQKYQVDWISGILQLSGKLRSYELLKRYVNKTNIEARDLMEVTSLEIEAGSNTEVWGRNSLGNLAVLGALVHSTRKLCVQHHLKTALPTPFNCYSEASWSQAARPPKRPPRDRSNATEKNLFTS